LREIGTKCINDTKSQFHPSTTHILLTNKILSKKKRKDPCIASKIRSLRRIAESWAYTLIKCEPASKQLNEQSFFTTSLKIWFTVSSFVTSLKTQWGFLPTKMWVVASFPKILQTLSLMHKTMKLGPCPPISVFSACKMVTDNAASPISVFLTYVLDSRCFGFV